jgi:pimeloyl-ACP methyl ester carboxylesterase
MPSDKINGVNLYWELNGSKGEPMVLVHGSWGDHHNWDNVITELAKTFLVLTYDRRGHSKSERPNGQGNIEEDVSDLIALIEYLDLSPAHIVGNSGGASVVLRTAIRKREVFKTLIVHEPALFGILKDMPEAKPILQVVNNRVEAVTNLIAQGENEQAAKLFVETIAFGEGAWQQLPEQVKQTFIYNAPTFYDETHDPQSSQLDTSKLNNFNQPALLTVGTASAPFFPWVVDKLAEAIPNTKRATFEGAGHVPHMTHPQDYVKEVKKFCLQ